MTKDKPFKEDIPKMYRRSAEDLLMYGYVSGLQKGLPDLSTKKCIELFLQEFGLEEDDYPFECAYTTFGRIRKERDVL